MLIKGELTFDEQVAGSANGSCLIGGRAAKATAVFGKRLTDQQPSDPICVANLEINGAFDLVVLSEPHDDRSRPTADLAFQSDRLALGHCHILQSLNRRKTYFSSFIKS